jgi:hypothetical protein
MVAVCEPFKRMAIHVQAYWQLASRLARTIPIETQTGEG